MFSVRRIIGLFILLSFCVAHANTSQDNNSTMNKTDHENKSFWRSLYGTIAPEPRLTLGMWSLHATKKRRNGNNQMIGFSYRGFTIGTFVNSYYRRAYAVGIQRFWLTRPITQDLSYQIGYRLGLVTGYSGHNLTGIRALKNAPFIPYAQIMLDFNWKYLGWEISSPDPYVISTGFYIRFL